MKILFISPWFPCPPVNGSKQRINALLTALAERHEVHLISFVRRDELVEAEALERSGIESIQIPFREFQPEGLKALIGLFSLSPRSYSDTFSQEMEKAIQTQISLHNPNLLIFSETTTASYYRAMKIPALLDEFEISTIYEQWNKSPQLIKRGRYWLTWQKQVQYFKRLIPRFNACTVVSEKEMNLLREIVPSYKPAAIIPNGIDLEHNQPSDDPVVPGRLVYNGALTYQANLDAVTYFLAEILPIIQREAPDVELHITGSYEGVEISKIKENRAVRLTGYVVDIRPLMHSASACVVPLRQGGGTRLKILESMALGIPVVSTLKGAEGLIAVPEKDLLVGENAGSFARQVIRLLKDPDLSRRLAKNGRELVEKNYDWKEIGGKFCQLAEEVGAKN